KRSQARTRINHLQSPILRRIPPEIISHIFNLYLPEFHIDNPRDSKEAVPLTLGAVCKSWRNIAWSSPTLWSSM
ncbi:hypothetical protein BYT27DRAFT_7093259, partial [Phlegmacium glaucopus]